MSIGGSIRIGIAAVVVVVVVVGGGGGGGVVVVVVVVVVKGEEGIVVAELDIEKKQRSLVVTHF